MALETRQVLEDAIVARLDLELGIDRQNLGATVSRGYLRTIAPYNGEIDGAQSAEDIRAALRGRAPGVLVSTTGATYQSRSTRRRRFDREITVELILISNHRRDRETRLRADLVSQGDPSADPGIYRILADVLQQLAGDDLGVDGIGPLSPSAEGPLARFDDFTAWQMTYRADELLKVPERLTTQAHTDYHLETQVVDEVNQQVIAEPPNPMVEADGQLPEE